MARVLLRRCGLDKRWRLETWEWPGKRLRSEFRGFMILDVRYGSHKSQEHGGTGLSWSFEVSSCRQPSACGENRLKRRSSLPLQFRCLDITVPQRRWIVSTACTVRSKLRCAVSSIFPFASFGERLAGGLICRLRRAVPRVWFSRPPLLPRLQI